MLKIEISAKAVSQLKMAMVIILSQLELLTLKLLLVKTFHENQLNGKHEIDQISQRRK